MSTFSGGMGKGAMRRHREILRGDAEERRQSFEAEVASVMREQNVTEWEARVGVLVSRWVARRTGGVA